MKPCASFLGDFLDQDYGIKVLLFGMNDDAEIFLKAVHLGICGYLPQRGLCRGDCRGGSGCGARRGYMPAQLVYVSDPISEQKKIRENGIR